MTMYSAAVTHSHCEDCGQATMRLEYEKKCMTGLCPVAALLQCTVALGLLFFSLECGRCRANGSVLT